MRLPLLRAIAMTGAVGPVAAGCAGPCLDDGLIQEDCPAENTESDSEDGTSSSSSSPTISDSLSDSVDDSGQTTESESTDATVDSSSESGAPPLWCVDADGDGFGDPDDCMNTDDPPDGSVQNDADCDDADDHTFPGAAENERDAAACMHDGDEDGWGDADPGTGAVAGADCYDGNAVLNPGTMAPATFVTRLGTPYIVEVDVSDASLTERTPLDPVSLNWDPVSATIDEAGTLLVNNEADDSLWAIDWSPYCAGEVAEAAAAPLPESHSNDVFCGIAFGAGGVLYGVESDGDTVAELDPATGAIVASVELVYEDAPYDVESCGLTFDCHAGALVFASGDDGSVYTLDPATGELELVVEIGTTWTPTGIGYDPVSRSAHVAADTELYRVALDGSGTVDLVGTFSFGLLDESLTSLDELPVCEP